MLAVSEDSPSLFHFLIVQSKLLENFVECMPFFFDGITDRAIKVWLKILQFPVEKYFRTITVGKCGFYLMGLIIPLNQHMGAVEEICLRVVEPGPELDRVFES